MIARMWRGTIRREDRDAYVAYVEATGLADYGATPGNLGAWILTREAGDRCEIVTLSYWASRAHIEAFAGADIDIARYYPEDDRWLLDRAERVEHYDVTP